MEPDLKVPRTAEDVGSFALSGIWMRDPFIVVIRSTATAPLTEPRYLLFGTTDTPPKRELAVGFHVRL